MQGTCREMQASPHTEDGLEVGEVADLVLRRGDPLGQRRALGIDPRGVHADAVRALDVDVGAIATKSVRVGSAPVAASARRKMSGRGLRQPTASDTMTAAKTSSTPAASRIPMAVGV